MCGAAAVARVDASGTCVEARLGFNGVAPKAFLHDLTTLAGAAPEEAVIDAACRSIEVDDPLGDVYASGEYRIELARVYGKRALARAFREASA